MLLDFPERVARAADGPAVSRRSHPVASVQVDSTQRIAEGKVEVVMYDNATEVWRRQRLQQPLRLLTRGLRLAKMEYLQTCFEESDNLPRLSVEKVREAYDNYQWKEGRFSMRKWTIINGKTPTRSEK